MHLGAGLVDTVDNITAQSFDPVAALGLKGTFTDAFPSIQGLSVAQGGLASLGPGSIARLVNTKPTANASLTWVKGNHTYKAGGEMIIEGYPATNETYANGWLVFSAIESGLPSTNGQSLAGGSVGFPYASFLLGGVDNGFIGVPSRSRLGAHAFSGFVQDSWKVTRKLTLDYGLRYDFQTYLREEHGRIAYFSASTPNPGTGGLLGAVAFDGSGPGHCNCSLAHNYPFAYGPRIGLAYQFAPKTVLRAGAGRFLFQDDRQRIEFSFDRISVHLHGADLRNAGLHAAKRVAVPDHLSQSQSRPGPIARYYRIAVATDRSAGRQARAHSAMEHRPAAGGFQRSSGRGNLRRQQGRLVEFRVYDLPELSYFTDSGGSRSQPEQPG